MPDVVYAGNRSTEVASIWCDSFGELGIYGQKNRDGALSTKNWRPLSPKLLIRLKNRVGCKNGTDILCLSQFGLDPPSAFFVKQYFPVRIF